MPDTEASEVNFMLALGLVGRFPFDRGGFEGGEFVVFLVLPGVLVNLFSDVKSKISFGRKELWTKWREKAALSIFSFPSTPLWSGIHMKVMFVLGRVARRM